MVEPEKPFACVVAECGMTFTNEDHLHVHTKKHDMVLQLGLEQRAAFVADQTPTPTRFIRNCEEVGLFQDLQNVNPFDEGFKRAMETKQLGLPSLDGALAPSSAGEDLHTPQMVFPLVDGDSALCTTTNNQRNITISRSSSDESGAIKEFETTTISKLTNEVTTISRIVGKTDEKLDDKINDSIRKDSVSYTNNVIKIQSSNLVRKDSIDRNPVHTLIYGDTVIKDSNVVTKDGSSADGKVCDIPPPILSQKSIDFIVDSLNNEYVGDETDKTTKRSKKDDGDYEVIIKLPNGKQVRMREVDEASDKVSAKEVLKKVLADKVEQRKCQPRVTNGINVVPISKLQSVVSMGGAAGVGGGGSGVRAAPGLPGVITAGTLIPVTIVSPPAAALPKVLIAPLKNTQHFVRKAEKRKSVIANVGKSKNDGDRTVRQSVSVPHKSVKSNTLAKDLDSRCAASRRYRARLKESWSRQEQENKQLREANEKLKAERTVLTRIISEHLKLCPHADELKTILDKLKNTTTML